MDSPLTFFEYRKNEIFYTPRDRALKNSIKVSKKHTIFDSEKDYGWRIVLFLRLEFKEPKNPSKMG